MMRPTLSREGTLQTPPEFKARDLGASVALGVVVLASAVFALKSAVAAEPVRSAPEPMTEHAVRILPVLDVSQPNAPLLKLGGKPDPSRLPDRVARPTPKARVEERAFASTKASKEPEAIPAPEVKMAAPEVKPPPPEAEITKQVDTPAVVPVDAGAPPPANVPEPGHADGVKEGTETDPLKARAVDLYRAKLAGWFSSRFRVTGSGLAQDELTKYRVSATITVGGDRTVSDFTMKPSGNAAFDAAATRALDASRGQSLPPPPENYPEIAQARISVTFVCRENRCD